MITGKRRLTGIVGLAALALLSTACNGSASGGGDGGSETVVLGSHVPLTGALADGGNAVKAGAEAYFDYINDQGGVNGIKIDYRPKNDDYDPARALQVVRELVQSDGAVGIVSTLGTSTGLAVAPYLESQKVPYVASLSGDPRLLGTDPSKPVFGIAPTGVEMGGSLGKYAVEQVGAKRVAVFYQNDAYGTDGRDGVREQVEAAGGTYAGDAPYDLGNTDYSAQIRKLRQADPDAVVLYALPATAAAFLTQARDDGWTDVQFMADNPMTDPLMVGLAGDALDGLITNFFTAVNGDMNQDVAKMDAILKKHAPDVTGGYYSYQGMAGAMVAVEALRAIDGDVTKESFAKALETVNFDPKVTAPVEYGPDDHSGANKFGFAEWKNGKIQVLQSY